MRRVFALGAIACAVALSACNSGRSPTKLAEDTTRALYADERDAATANFDEALKAQVTRAQVGALSDLMHQLGAYQGLKPTASDADTGRYEFQANFEKGILLVEMRLDPSGKIGAYRIVPAAKNAHGS